MIDKESLDSAVSLTIAKEIIGNLGAEYRDQLLENSIKSTLQGFNVASKIEAAVADAALATAREMLATETYQSLIRDAVRSGVEKYLRSIPDAITDTLVDAFHGNEGGSYDRRGGKILEYLKRSRLNSK